MKNESLGPKAKRLIYLIIFLLVVVIPAKGAKKTRGYKPKIIIKSADSQSVDGNRFIASGNVEVALEGYRLFADYLEFDRKSKKLMARGRVTMTSKETVISGEKFCFDVNERTGELYETYGQLSPTIRYTTDELNQVNIDTLTFKKMDFTPCAQCVPRWKITCANGKIKKEKYIEMKNVLFKIKKVPVFYLPYLRYPIDEDGRSTGFLLPVAGKSTSGGVYLLNAFYWAIKPNVDLTLGFDYYSRAGQGISQEFRYLLRNIGGNIKFYLFHYRSDFHLAAALNPGSEEAVGTDIIPRKYDYFFKMTHNQAIPFFTTKTRLTVDIDRQSDPNFLRLFGANFDTVTNRLYRSSLSLTSSLANLKFSMNAAQNDTYNLVNNRTVTKKYLPTLQFNVNQQRVWKLPAYFSLGVSYSIIDKEVKNYETGVESVPDISSTRLHVSPSLTLNLLKVPWLSATLLLKSGHSFYNRSLDPEADEITVLDTPVDFDYQTADFSIKGPVFSRIFQFKTSKLKHLIEPKVTVKYAANAAAEVTDRLIVMDSLDRPVNAYSYVGVSLTNRLLFKSKSGSGSTASKKSSAREILSYTVKQDYYFDPVEANRNRTIGDTYPRFSQLTNTLRLRPIKEFYMDTSLYFNHYLKQFTYVMVTLGCQGKNSPVTGNFKYIKNINPYKYKSDAELQAGSEENSTGTTDFWSETVGGGLRVDFPRFPLKLRGRVDYDIHLRKFRNHSVGLSFDYQCLTFNAGLKVFNIYGKKETRFDFGISFGNLGTVRDLLGL
jgi:lipopolysaccharide assembly outer membrane protein LptD (OstA)